MDRAPAASRVRERLPAGEWLAAIVAAAGALAIVWQWAHARPFWLDEEMIALNLRDRTFAALGGELWLDQSAPLGWLVLQRCILLVLGTSELALRAVPAVFGVATVATAFFAGRRWLTPAGTLVFVLLCSLGQWISFYAVELKSYSADTFFGLLLPVLAVAAAGAPRPEAPGPGGADARRRHAVLTWFAVAAIGHWFSLGALLVVPAGFAVLALSLRTHRELIRVLAAGAAVLVLSIGANYVLSLRHTQNNASLQEYWQFAMAPAGSGIAARLQWLYGQLEPFAMKPGGTAMAAAFWLCAALGFAFAPNRLLGFAAGLVVLTGFALAGLRLMPLYERLSLWFVPALYLGVALFADRAGWFLRRQPFKLPLLNLAGAGLVATAVLVVAADVAERGIRDLRTGRPRASNHETDDRTAVRWLMQQRQPGDALVTTTHALAAVWWYGGVSLSESGGRRFADGGPILTAEYYKSPRVCRGRELEGRLDGRSRVQVYLGFVDMPPGFDDLLLDRLSKFGTITTVRHFAGASRAAVVDARLGGRSNLFWEDAGKDSGTWLQGCVAARQARAW